MLKPRDGEMNYEKLEDLAFYYMFIASCLPETQYNALKKRWNQKGGVKYMPWWKFIAENVTIMATPIIPVISTYSFDNDAPVVLCSSDEEAEEYLEHTFKQEVKSDETNGWDCCHTIDDDKRYAKITNQFPDRLDVTEFRIGHAIQLHELKSEE